MKIINSTFSAILALLIFLPILTNAQEQTERLDQSYPFNSNGKISVSNINGSITVEAWDRNEIKIEAVKTADSRESLSMVDIEINAKMDSFKVSTDYKNWNNDGRNNNWRNGRSIRVEFKMTVPRTAYLDEIETVNGSVIVSNMTNYTKISAVNGGVKAVNLSGTANLSTVNGKTEADFDSLRETDKISLDTVNGTVNLLLPSDINATVKASTVNGSIKNDFGLPVRKGKYVGRDLYGKIGSGGVEVKLSAVNGTLSIKRKNDGKSANPATNLLKMNSDDDFEYNNDTSKRTAEINRELAKAQRDAEKAQREAQRNIIEIQPVINDIIIDTIINTTTNTTMLVNKEVQEKIREQFARQRDQLARLRNANFSGIPNVSQKTDTFTIKDKPKIKIVASDCAIAVRGWDKPEIKYVLTEFATGRDNSGDVKASQKGSNVTISIVNDEGKSGDDYNAMRLEIFVPRKSDLKIYTNGEIRLEGISGEVELKGGEGAIDVRNTDGKLAVNSADGRIRVIGFSGEIIAETADGDAFLEGKFDKLSARTVDGTVVLTIPSETGATLTANRGIKSENINLTADGDKKWKIGNGNAKYDLSAEDGELIVRGMKEVIY